MEYFTIGIISYLMGSIPFGLIVTRVFLKKDIRDIGSGNIGATNALRTGNKLIGYTTLILDISKAIIPFIYVKINFPELIFIASLCAFLGHVFPIWLKFKGGKGVATYVGILFSINILFGLIFVSLGPLKIFPNKNPPMSVEIQIRSINRKNIKLSLSSPKLFLKL